MELYRHITIPKRSTQFALTHFYFLLFSLCHFALLLLFLLFFINLHVYTIPVLILFPFLPPSSLTDFSYILSPLPTPACRVLLGWN
jgi:hypothetical protein